MKGITVTLYENVETGTDAFNHTTYAEQAIEVENVLVAPASSTEVVEALNLTGKKIVYNLAIPKGDTHEWTDCRVDFFGEKWRTVGYPQVGIETLIPTAWHKKVMVERYG